MKLDPRTPGGPIEQKWANAKFEMRLVNPANKRKYKVIVVGSGLAGGLPRGQVSEVVGPASSGRTSVAWAALAAASRRGESIALIDTCDRFDPPTHDRGAVLLVVDGSLAVDLVDALNQYRQDLAGDGWQVIEITSPRAA